MTGYSVDQPMGTYAAVASRWWVTLLFGVAGVVVGTILVLDLVVAVETLALLVALGFMFTGIGELAWARDNHWAALSVVSGVLMMVAAIVALAWPGITLWALAVVTAMGLMFSGATRIAAARAARPEGETWLILGGMLSIVVGVIAVFWPAATVLVLALLLGIRMIVYGAIEISLGLKQRSLQTAH